MELFLGMGKTYKTPISGNIHIFVFFLVVLCVLDEIIVSFHLDNLIFLEMVRMLWIRMCVLPFWLQVTFKVCSNSVSVNMKQIQASPIIHNESFRTLFFFGVCVKLPAPKSPSRRLRRERNAGPTW